MTYGRGLRRGVWGCEEQPHGFWPERRGRQWWPVLSLGVQMGEAGRRSSPALWVGPNTEPRVHSPPRPWGQRGRPRNVRAEQRGRGLTGPSVWILKSPEQRQWRSCRKETARARHHPCVRRGDQSVCKRPCRPGKGEGSKLWLHPFHPQTPILCLSLLSPR